MKEFKIVKNHLNDMYNVVEVSEDCYACPIGQGKTKSQAMHNAYSNHKFCQQASNGAMEDILIIFDYEE